MNTLYDIGDKISIIEPCIEGIIIKMIITGIFKDNIVYTAQYWDSDNQQIQVDLFEFEFELVEKNVRIKKIVEDEIKELNSKQKPKKPRKKRKDNDNEK